MHIIVQKLIFYGIAFLATRMLVGSYSSLYLLSKGLPIEGLAMLKGMQAGIILILSIPFSYLSDKYGREKIVSLSFLCSAIWLALTAYGSTVSWLYAGEVFNALSLALFNGPFEALLIDAFQKNHPSRKISEILGIFSKYSFIVMALAALLGAMLATSTESSLFWWISFLILMGFYVSTFKFLKNRNENCDSYSMKNIFSKSDFLSHMKATLNIISNNKYFLIPFLLLAIAVNLYYQVILQYWQPMASLLMDDLKSTFFYGILFVFILLAQSASGKSIMLFKNIKNLLFILIFLLVFTSFILVFFQRMKNIFGISLIVLSFFIIRLIQIIVSGKINELIPGNQRATFISSTSTIMRLFLFPSLFIIATLVSIMGLQVIPALGTLLIISIPMLVTISTNEKTENVKS